MSIVISWIIGGIVSYLASSYTFCEITGKTERMFKMKWVIYVALFSLVNAYSTIWFCPELKVIVNIITLISFFKLVFNQTLACSVIVTMLIFLVTALIEMVLGTTMVQILRIDQSFFNNNALGIILTNMVANMILVLIIKFDFFRKVAQDITRWYEQRTSFNLIFFVSLGIASVMMLLYQNSSIVTYDISYLANNAYIVGIVIFVIAFFKEKSTNSKLSLEYDRILNYATTCEEKFEKQRKNQHEYKNQLRVIRDMIVKDSKNKKATNYISKTLDEVESDQDYVWLTKLQYIPDGIKGFLYFKIVEMQKKGISVFVTTSATLKNNAVKKLCTKHLRDISYVIGVYIDNAIEAANLATKKFIIIEADYRDDMVIFSFFNTYQGNLDIEHMDKEGFSTKGTNRGYGLSLVRDIIHRNEHLDQSREVSGIYFVHRLIIKK